MELMTLFCLGGGMMDAIITGGIDCTERKSDTMHQIDHTLTVTEKDGIWTKR